MKKSFIAVLVLLTAGHSVECLGFNDNCDYTLWGEHYLCGNFCLNNRQTCNCGDQTIKQGWNGDQRYCCAPASACTRTNRGASCSIGEALSAFSDVPCKYTGRCNNDVLTTPSQHLNKYWAKYTCPDKCIYWEDMCQGVNHCSGVEEACGPQLNCPTSIRIAYFISRYNMSTIPVRSYCYEDVKLKRK